MVHACRRPVSAFQGPRSPRSHWPSLIDLCTSLCYIDIQIGATNQVELTTVTNPAARKRTCVVTVVKRRMVMIATMTEMWTHIPRR